MAHSLPRQRTQRTRTCAGWPWILVAALLHLTVISWGVGAMRFPSFSPEDNSIVIAATLLTPPKPEVSATAPSPKKKRKRRAPPAAQPLVQPTPVTESVVADAIPEQPETQTSNDAGTDAIESDAEEASATAEQQNGLPYKISLPPSAELEYDVQKTSKENQPMYGHGTISWQTDGSSYSVIGDAGVLFFTVLTFKSEGTIDDTGVVPELYSEKRFRKSEINTHFHRERNTISFSSSTKSYPRTGVEQDRASVIWQLAGIGRGGEKFVPGAEIDLIVAGTRDMDMWRMQIVGEEDVIIDGKTTRAWHITRVPRNGSHDQKLDIWLAPQQNWYPVRLRYTETNGDYLDMSLTSLNISATH